MQYGSVHRNTMRKNGNPQAQIRPNSPKFERQAILFLDMYTDKPHKSAQIALAILRR